MNNIVAINAIADKETNLFISTSKAIELSILNKTNLIISFGTQKQIVNIAINDEIEHDTLNISQKVIAELHLPKYPVYELCFNNEELIIGPYIGLLLSSEKRFTKTHLNKLLVYFKKYSEIHGAIVVFALNKVNTEKRLIEGFCYNPSTNSFEKGVFPYPCAIYRKIGLSQKWKNHFVSAIGDKMFNSYYFDKWEMYQWYSGNAELVTCLPYTCLYKKTKDVLNALDLYENIYVKPISGLRGHSIVKISKRDAEYIFKYRLDNINHTDVFQNIKEVRDNIRKHFLNRRFLIQQSVELITYRGGVIDFRCIMQKNQSNLWECKAVIARCGEKDSIVSNISSGGRAYKGVDIFEKAIGMPLEQRIILKEEIISLAIKICNALDDYSINCGSLGLDIGVDTNLSLWLFEINNRDPDPSISMNIHDVKLYHNLKAGILLYGKYLAGFGG